MNTRQRAAYLKKHGYTRSPLSFARGANTYRHANGSTITIPQAAPSNAPFIALGGAFSLISATRHIENTADAFEWKIAEMYARFSKIIGEPPDDLSEDNIQDELFRAIVKINNHIGVSK